MCGGFGFFLRKLFVSCGRSLWMDFHGFPMCMCPFFDDLDFQWRGHDTKGPGCKLLNFTRVGVWRGTKSLVVLYSNTKTWNLAHLRQFLPRRMRRDRRGVHLGWGKTGRWWAEQPGSCWRVGYSPRFARRGYKLQCGSEVFLDKQDIPKTIESVGSLHHHNLQVPWDAKGERMRKAYGMMFSSIVFKAHGTYSVLGSSELMINYNRNWDAPDSPCQNQIHFGKDKPTRTMAALLNARVPILHLNKQAQQVTGDVYHIMLLVYLGITFIHASS